MAADTTLQEAIIACGQVGATKPEDLMRGLRILGKQSKWRRFYRTRVPDVCIIRVAIADKASHWVYRYYDGLFNPAALRLYQWNPPLADYAKSLIEIL